MPLLEILIGKLNQDGQLVKNFDKRTILGYDLDGLIDVEQVHKDYKPLLDAGGMTLNELRDRMGLPESTDPFLNQFYGTRNQVPLEMIGLAMPSEQTLEGVLAGEGPKAPVVEPVEEPALEVPVAGVDPIAPDQSAVPTETLNGAQIQSLVAIAVAVADGSLPKDTGVQIIAASYPFTEERAARILEQVIASSIKPPPPPPVMVPPGVVLPVEEPEKEDGLETEDDPLAPPAKELDDEDEDALPTDPPKKRPRRKPPTE